MLSHVFPELIFGHDVRDVVVNFVFTVVCNISDKIEFTSPEE